jgi:hypothetical protein
MQVTRQFVGTDIQVFFIRRICHCQLYQADNDDKVMGKKMP